MCARVPSQSRIPYFNAPIYLKNKTQIGRVDEILGPLNQLYFTVKTLDSIPAASFVPGDVLYIGSDKLLPLERFLPKSQAPKRNCANCGQLYVKLIISPLYSHEIS